MFQQCYILYPFRSVSAIVTTTPLAYEADICTIYRKYLCFLNPHPKSTCLQSPYLLLIHNKRYW